MSEAAMQQNRIVADVRCWLESFIIELNLCPFAKRELVKNRIRFTVSSAVSAEQLLTALLEEMRLLEADPETETTLLIHPDVLQEFEGYNQFLDLADALIDQEGYGGVFQVASFHPQYRFAQTEDEAENYSNRSPYPLLHILRESSVAVQVESYPDIAAIPQKNIELLRKLGVEKLRSLLEKPQNHSE